MKYVVFRSFLKKLDSYREKEQKIIVDAIEKIKNYLETNEAPYGLRIKRLSKKIYEGRINIHLRVVYFREKEVVKFFCLGNHDDIKHCLKTSKQRLK
ncbi:MAG: hypothetical protein ISS33_06155 [Candidatus Omnitrophica bacterium]|nr:hypothetical protein [Candidatus Omnitrophota bacterium]